MFKGMLALMATLLSMFTGAQLVTMRDSVAYHTTGNFILLGVFFFGTIVSLVTLLVVLLLEENEDTTITEEM